MSEINRRALYKNNDRDFESQRRNRNDHSVEIRKAKKEDQLQKRRNIQIDDLSDGSPVKENTRQINEFKMSEIPKMLKSKNLSQKIDAAISARKLLSKVKNPPIEEFYVNGSIPLFVDIMKTEDDEILIFETAWALTNIASGDSKHTAAVVDNGAIPVFMKLISHTSDQISEQCIWALGNIAGDSAKYRDMIVDFGVVSVVKNAVCRFWTKLDILGHLCWLISNLCRHKSKKYPTSAILELLPVVREILVKVDNKPIQVDLTWALTYASDSHDEVIEAMIATQLVELVIGNLSRQVELVTPSLRAVGNVIAGTNEQADAAIRAGIIGAIAALLAGQSQPRIVKECCWVLSNVSAGTEAQVDALIESGVLAAVMEVMRNGDYKSQKEAVWVVSNMISGKKDAHKFYLLNNNVFAAAVPLLNCDDNKVVLLLLDAIRELFLCADNIGELDPCLAVFESVGGIEMVESLQNHLSEEIYRKSYDLVQDYFGGEEDGDQDDDASHQANGPTENVDKYVF